MHKQFIKYFVNPIVWPALGSKRIKLFHQFRKQQYQKSSELEQKQKKELFNLINYCETNIPYYQNIIKKNKISYNKETIFEDIKKFPILTKELIRKHKHQLTNPNIKAKQNTSGGTTGEPVIFLQDKSYQDHNAAATALCDEWGGRSEGEYVLKLWGSERDIAKGSQGVRGLLVQLMLNEKLINTFSINKHKLESIVNLIREKKPRIIIGYVQSVELFAKYVEENNIKFTHKFTIITSAGTLYPDIQKRIEKTLHCKVLNRYGSREVGLVASSCDKQKGLHLNTFTNYVEILTDSFEPVKNGTGEIYVTTLHNYAMPLIRYRLGDRLTVNKQKVCSCKRGLPLIKQVEGRTVQVFINNKGEKIDGEYFTHLFYQQPWLRQFQLIQKKRNLVELHVVFERTPTNKEKLYIESGIWKVMTKHCKINWIEVKQIKPHKNGKYSFTISEVTS